MKNRITITLLVFLFVLGLQFNSQAQCPGTVLSDANGKCIDLFWDTPPNPIPATILVDGVTYEYLIGFGGEPPWTYRDSNFPNYNCTAAIKNYSGTIVINGEECIYLDGTLPIIVTMISTEIVGSSIVLTCKFESTGEEGHVSVERSSDLVKWESITILDTDFTRINNSFVYKDERPANGLNYYRVSVIDEDGIIIASELVNEYFTVDGDIALYPNPVNDILQVKNSGKESIDELVVYDQYGRKVKIYKGSIDKIDFTEFPNGMYHLRATLENGQVIQKNIVK